MPQLQIKNYQLTLYPSREAAPVLWLHGGRSGGHFDAPQARLQRAIDRLLSEQTTIPV